MLMVEGETARALDELARERWQRVTGERCGRRARTTRSALAGRRRALVRTRPGRRRAHPPGWREQPEVREIEALYLRAIGAARRCIYIENQYLTVPPIAEALAARLGERHGPEVIISAPRTARRSSRPR